MQDLRAISCMSERIKRGTVTRIQRRFLLGEGPLTGATMNLCEESHVINVTLSPLSSLDEAAHHWNPTGSHGSKGLLVQPLCQFPEPGQKVEQVDPKRQRKYQLQRSVRVCGVAAVWGLGTTACRGSTCQYSSYLQRRQHGMWLSAPP